MYDWANSAFATTIMTALFPAFYSLVAAANLDKTTASSYWAFTNTIAMLVIALAAPVLGAISDHSATRKKFLCGFAAMGIVATTSMIAIGNGMWFYASLVYIFGRIGFSGANIFYDSLLPHVARPKEIDQVSANGYAYGYLGGGILLLINLTMIMKPHLFGISDKIWASKISFCTVAAWWLVFSIPIFKNVTEPKSLTTSTNNTNPIKAGFQSLNRTFKEIRKFKELVKFLIAFWLYNDGIGTIIVMAVIFGTEIGIGEAHLIGAILMVQFAGIPFTILFGRLPKKLGTKNSIILTLAVYTIISVLGYFTQTAFHFWLLAILVATVQGGAQTLSRSMFASMIPKSRSAEFFGFYSVSSKFSGIIGPLIFGLVGQLTGSSRLSILSIIIFFVSGTLVLTTVNHKKGIEAAAEE